MSENLRPTEQIIRELVFNNSKEQLIKLPGGSIQRTYLHPSFGIVHIAPHSHELTESEAVVCNRWLIPNKGSVLKEYQDKLQDSENVVIPRVHYVGSFTTNTGNHEIWTEDFLPGVTLKEQTFDGVDFLQYEKLVEFLAHLHERNIGNTSLQEYYIYRLAAITSTLQSSPSLTSVVGVQFRDQMLQAIQHFQNQVGSVVDKAEKAGQIHGDFRGDNILFSDDTIGVIDFEQGVNGGDWFTDLDKLLRLGSELQPHPKSVFEKSAVRFC